MVWRELEFNRLQWWSGLWRISQEESLQQLDRGSCVLTLTGSMQERSGKDPEGQGGSDFSVVLDVLHHPCHPFPLYTHGKGCLVFLMGLLGDTMFQ